MSFHSVLLWLALLMGHVPSEDWTTLLPGQWIGADKGDATKNGKLVEGGARVRFVHGQKGSRTPWNVTFIAPKPEHMTAETVSGGCGFYESGKAFCRGYGIPADGKAMETEVFIELDDEGRLRFAVAGLGGLTLVRGE